jgi:hypothetical protein
VQWKLKLVRPWAAGSAHERALRHRWSRVSATPAQRARRSSLSTGAACALCALHAASGRQPVTPPPPPPTHTHTHPPTTTTTRARTRQRHRPIASLRLWTWRRTTSCPPTCCLSCWQTPHSTRTSLTLSW